MKHLSSTLLSIGVILSVVSIILPQWSVLEAGKGNLPVYSQHSGLWELCVKTSDDGQKFKCMVFNNNNKPQDILLSQIFSIVGTVALAIGAVMYVMNKPGYSKLATGLGVTCLTTVLIVYGAVIHGHIGRSYTPTASNRNLTTNKLGTSYWLELSAVVTGLLGLLIMVAKK